MTRTMGLRHFPMVSGVLALSAILGSESGAQTQESWTRLGPANGIEGFARAANGDLLVTYNSPQAISARIGADGSPIWQTTFPGYVGSIAEDSAGSVVSAGAIGNLSLNSDVLVLKHDAAGALVWSRTYDGTSSDFVEHADAVAVGPQDDVFVAGTGGCSGLGGQQMLVARYSASGNLLWSTCIPGLDGKGVVRDLEVDSAGNAYLCGYGNYTPSAGVSWFVVVRVDANGSIAWIRHPSTSHGYAEQLALDASGNVYVAGMVAQIFTLVKYTPAGALAWSREAPSSGGADHAWSVAVDSDQDVVVTGFLEPWNYVLHTARYDPSGNLRWARTFQDPAPLQGRRVVLDGSGDAFVVASAFYSGYPQDAAVVRYDRSGAERWVARLTPGQTGEFFTDAVLDPAGSLLLGGFYRYPQGSFTSMLLRLDPNVVAFCAGNGSGTACPCANESSTNDRVGCLHSLGMGGKLSESGISSLSSDSFVLVGTQMPDASALYFQGTAEVAGGAGTVFGDGLLCAGGSLRRLGQRNNVLGTSQFPSFGGPSVSAAGLVGAPGTRIYQVWYRNAAAYCTAGTFNLTNALRVTWVP